MEIFLLKIVVKMNMLKEEKIEASIV